MPPAPQPLTTVQAPRQLSIVRFSPCGQWLFGAGGDARVYRWQAREAELAPLETLAGHHGWIDALAFDGSEGRLFTGDSWGQLCCWPYKDAQPQPQWSLPAAHDGWIRQAAVSPDGALLATCGRDGRVALWTTADGEPRRDWRDHEADVFSVAFHPDGKSLVSGDLKGVVIHWDLESGREVRRLDAKTLYLLDNLQDVGGVRRLVFSADGKSLAAAGARPQGGGFVQATPLVRVFHWESGEAAETQEFGTEKDGFVHDLAFHPDGYWLGATSGQPGNGKFFLWRAGEKQPFVSQALANCHSVALHPGGVRFAVAATNGSSNGNGRMKKADEAYKGNWSPISLWDVTKLQA